MSVSDYIYQAIHILEGLIVAGIAFRCVKTLITMGVEEGDWARAFKKIKNQIMAVICAVAAFETLIVIKNIFGG